jgi:biotin carboxyl carrier protein
VKFVATVDGEDHSVDVALADGCYRVTIGEQVWDVDARLGPDGIASLLIGGVSHIVEVSDHGGARLVEVGGERYVVEIEESTRHVIRTRGGVKGGPGGQIVKAPMPGRITHVSVRPGDAVDAGDTLLVIEAMKMENELRAGHAGTVAEVRVEAGQTVNPGDVLIVISERSR